MVGWSTMLSSCPLGQARLSSVLFGPLLTRQLTNLCIKWSAGQPMASLWPPIGQPLVSHGPNNDNIDNSNSQYTSQLWLSRPQLRSSLPWRPAQPQRWPADHPIHKSVFFSKVVQSIHNSIVVDSATAAVELALAASSTTALASRQLNT